MQEALWGALIPFARSCIGIIVRPYETYRRIAEKATIWELVWVAALAVLYFATASVVKTAAFRPFLLTRQFIVLVTVAFGTFYLSVQALWFLGKAVGARGSYRALVSTWGYAMVPTIAWFWSTSLLYVLIPPPRSTSTAGVVFSLVYLLFSVILLWWKVVLAYLSLRFSLRLDLAKICVVAVFFLFFLSAYSFCMYQIGIFRVPFV